MKVINARNVNEALQLGVNYIFQEGVTVNSRNGMTLEAPTPVATVYQKPNERVLIDPVRDANPFFHFFESLWILAGRKDVEFLTEFNKQMALYSDDGEEFNAPYGYRMRNGVNIDNDQILNVISILNEDKDSRQAVIQIWDEADLYKKTKDKACNMSVVFKIRKDNKLHITVYNRSNDMLWGAYGANVVQFSMLQEYVAAALDRKIGTYTQVSNSYHVYLTGKGGELTQKMKERHFNRGIIFDPYTTDEMVNMSIDPYDFEAFDHDLRLFFDSYDEDRLEACLDKTYNSPYFTMLVLPMLRTFRTHKLIGPGEALRQLDSIGSDDWAIACEQWLRNRIK